MSRQIFFRVACLVTLFLCAPLAHAGISISEIMYDNSGSDKGGEWIEVTNSGQNFVDIGAYRLAEGGTNHKLRPVSGGTNLPPGSFVIISSDTGVFRSLHPDFSGILFESSFSLNNSGEVISLKDSKLGIVDQVSYSSAIGADGDGSSLQRFQTGWQASKPTIGVLNQYASSVTSPVINTPQKTVQTQTEKNTPTISNKSKSSSTQIAAAGNTKLKTGDGLFRWGIVIGGALIAAFLGFFLSPRQPKTESEGVEISE